MAAHLPSCSQGSCMAIVPGEPGRLRVSRRPLQLRRPPPLLLRHTDEDRVGNYEPRPPPDAISSPAWRETLPGLLPA